MKKRLTLALAAGALVAAMVPDVASAANPPCTVVGTPGNDTFATGSGYGGTVIPADAVVCGGKGNDTIYGPSPFTGTFYGGQGDEYVSLLSGGTVLGGQGDDFVYAMYSGTFDAGLGDDRVCYLGGGTYNGGAGTDSVASIDPGATAISVEVVDPSLCAN
jgi:hypothetical protein